MRKTMLIRYYNKTYNYFNSIKILTSIFGCSVVLSLEANETFLSFAASNSSEN